MTDHTNDEQPDAQDERDAEIVRAAGTVFDAAAQQAMPRIDTAAIVRALPAAKASAAPQAKPVLKVERGAAKRWFGLPRYAVAAAATVLVALGVGVSADPGVLSIFAWGTEENTQFASQDVPVAILGASTLHDLTADELETFLADLDHIEATVAEQPGSYATVASAFPEEY